MTRLFARSAILVVCALLAGCTPGGNGVADPPQPAPTEAIGVTALPPGGLQDKADAALPDAAAATSDAAVAAVVTAQEAPADAPEGRGNAPADPATGGDAAPITAAPAPPPPLSAEARACKRTGGRYLGTGTGTLRACVKLTGEGAKRCTRETDCEGVCLARSGTCAPATPLFGCNEILQADGRRVTLCID